MSYYRAIIMGIPKNCPCHCFLNTCCQGNKQATISKYITQYLLFKLVSLTDLLLWGSGMIAAVTSSGLWFPLSLRIHLQSIVCLHVSGNRGNFLDTNSMISFSRATKKKKRKRNAIFSKLSPTLSITR